MTDSNCTRSGTPNDGMDPRAATAAAWLTAAGNALRERGRRGARLIPRTFTGRLSSARRRSS